MLKRFVDVKDEEAGSVLLAFAYFFSLMCGYGILKPLRDEMGTAGGLKNVPWLFTATFGVMLVAVPAFSALVSRWPRRRVIPWVNRFFLFNLLTFFVLLKLEVGRVWVVPAFFVWVSVYNLFVVSVFWSFMTDLFASEQGRRLFGFIAAGGTLGMMAGLGLVATLSRTLGAMNLMLLSAVLLEGSARCVRQLSRQAPRVQHQPVATVEAPVGGGIFAGPRLLFSSPLLLGLGVQMLLYAATSTFLYNQQAQLVARVASGADARAATFGSIELWGHVLTVLLQLVVTGRLMSRFGLGVALAVAPVLTAVGFLGLAALPTLAMLIVFKALRGASHHAFERPGRELLFTRVDGEARYKAKGFIDTVVYRGSDSVGAWVYKGLDGLGLGMTGLSLAAVPVAGLWLAVSLWLARLAGRPRPSDSAPASALAPTADAAR